MDNYALDKYTGCEASSPIVGRAVTLKQRLDSAVSQAETQLRDAQEARDILDRHPDMERLLNIMQKGRF